MGQSVSRPASDRPEASEGAIEVPSPTSNETQMDAAVPVQPETEAHTALALHPEGASLSHRASLSIHSPADAIAGDANPTPSPGHEDGDDNLSATPTNIDCDPTSNQQIKGKSVNTLRSYWMKRT